MSPAFRDIATQPAQFVSTRWTVVLAAGGSRLSSVEARNALAELCRIYWRPLYLFLRRQGFAVDDAQDLTQGFFADLIATRSYTRAGRDKGRFRSFLLGALKHFVADARDREQAQKRGGGKIREPFDEATISEAENQVARNERWQADRVYDREWAETLLRQALARLAQECAFAGKASLFERSSPTFRRTARRPSPTTSCRRGCGGPQQRCAKMRRDCAPATARSSARRSTGR